MTLGDALFLVLVLLTFADLGTTIEALDLGAKEQNGFLRWLFGELGTDAILFPFKWAVIGGIGYYRYHSSTDAVLLLAFLDVVYAGVIWNNWRVLKKQRKKSEQ